MIAKDEAVKAKIRALAQGVKVWVLEPGRRYVSPSCSQEGTAYEVLVQSTGITCTCPGATHRGICKHIGIVLVRLEVEQSEQQQAPPDPSQAQEEERTMEDKLTDLYPRRR
jgi:hypothetical protein